MQVMFKNNIVYPEFFTGGKVLIGGTWKRGGGGKGGG